MTQHGPWKINSSQEIYRDAWLNLRLDLVDRPDGLPGTYSTVRLKPGVCVIAIDESLQVYLTREFHYAVGRITIEGVSGGVEDSERPEVAARRELEEELGIRATRWQSMGSLDPFTASVASPTNLYVASGLSFGASNTEGTEKIEMVQCSFEQALAWLEQGEITHAPTCVILLKLALLRQRKTGLHAALGFA